MASYSLFIKQGAEKELMAIPKQDRIRIVSKIRALASTPRPAGCEKLRGDTAFRVRQGDWRIIYEVSDEQKTVTVFKIGHRREVYR